MKNDYIVNIRNADEVVQVCHMVVQGLQKKKEMLVGSVTTRHAKTLKLSLFFLPFVV